MNRIEIKPCLFLILGRFLKQRGGNNPCIPSHWLEPCSDTQKQEILYPSKCWYYDYPQGTVVNPPLLEGNPWCTCWARLYFPLITETGTRRSQLWIFTRRVSISHSLAFLPSLPFLTDLQYWSTSTLRDHFWVTESILQSYIFLKSKSKFWQ